MVSYSHRYTSDSSGGPLAPTSSHRRWTHEVFILGFRGPLFTPGLLSSWVLPGILTRICPGPQGDSSVPGPCPSERFDVRTRLSVQIPEPPRGRFLWSRRTRGFRHLSPVDPVVCTDRGENSDYLVSGPAGVSVRPW